MIHLFIRPLLAALALAGILTGCSHTQENSADNAPNTRTISTPIITLNLSNQSETASFPGTVVAQEQIQIASRIMGYVRQINVETGEAVHKDQLLITVDPTDIQGQVSMSDANLAQADAALADAKNDYDRFGELYREEAIPKAQWDKVRLQYTIAQSQAIAARALHNTAAEQMRYAAIHAPFAGVITQRMASVGALATPGQPLLMLINPKHLDIETQVPDDVYAGLTSGESVTVQVNNQTIIGSISSLVAAVDPTTRTHLVKIDTLSASTLQNGMFAQIDFPTAQQQGMRLPNSAIINRTGITGVFVVDGQNIAHFRMIRTGESIAGMTDILAGINSGERVIDRPPDELQSGDHIIQAGAGNV